MTNAKQLTTGQRIERAKVITNRLVDHTRELIAAAENNAIVLYSNRISSQIPRSYAANAFNELQRGLHYFHLVRLCALWDKASLQRESIQTVVSLVEDIEVRNALAEATFEYHSTLAEPRRLTPTSDPIEADILSELWARHQVRRAAEERAKVQRWLAFAIRVAPKVERCIMKDSLRPFRDAYLAHNLDPDADKVKLPAKLRYGDEGKLLRLTVRVVDRLHLAVNGTSFDWETAQEQASRNAEELWSACKISFPR